MEIEKKVIIQKTWQTKYFILTDKKLYYFKDKNKLNKDEFIDLHNIEFIDDIPVNSQYTENNINYYQFHLKSSDRLWKLRCMTNDKRILWTNCIFAEWNKLRLTLVRYKQILSEIKLRDGLKDLFVSRSYTISNIIDDHIHVMRYHNNINYIKTFDLNDCNKDTCPSWKRFNLPRNRYCDKLKKDNDKRKR